MKPGQRIGLYPLQEFDAMMPGPGSEESRGAAFDPALPVPRAPRRWTRWSPATAATPPVLPQARA